jgi:hypothetical protein
MILRILASVALVFQGTDAFVPSSFRKPAQRVNDLHGNRSPQRNQLTARLIDEKVLVDPIDPQDKLNMHDTDFVGEISEKIDFFVQPEETAFDEGKEIFLGSIANTKPEDIIPDADIVVSEHVQSMFAEPVDEESKGKEKVLAGIDFATFDNSTIMNDDLKAVLVASGEAAAAAEASMPTVVIEQLDFSSTMNATTASPLMEVHDIPEILSAASVVGEPATKIEAPGVSKILKFAIPAIGVWLCGPLLSLIDTSAVGLFSGTIQQAALNPAVAVTDYAALLIVSCCIVLL